jgi:NtrC-family two-component system sensor histidine kinase KinB
LIKCGRCSTPHEIMRSAGGDSAASVRELPLPEATRAAIQDALRGQRAPLTVDLSKAITVTASGKPRKLLPRIVPIEGRGAVLVLSDVTELVRLDEMRVELVAVASHELRTPLTTLRMTLLMLQERASRLETHDRELVSTALMGVEQLAATVDEFLDLTRIEAGQLRLHCDRADVAALLGRAVEAIKATCEGARITLRLEVVENAPHFIWGDATRLGVVLSNILSNAVKYTPADGEIHIAAQPVDAGRQLRIAITDTGPGVPPEFQGLVFDKFFRVEHRKQDVERGVRGSGIGLYIAREVVEAHRGSIRCETGPDGRGARFAIVLPVDAPDKLVSA